MFILGVYQIHKGVSSFLGGQRNGKRSKKRMNFHIG